MSFSASTPSAAPSLRVLVFLLVPLWCLVLGSPALRAQNTLQALPDEAFLERLRSRFTLAAPEAEGQKCGLALMSEAARRLHEGSEAQRRAIKAVLAPNAFDTSIVSASGRFRVYFDLSGPNTPALLQNETTRIPGTAIEYARQVASFFDRTWEVEVRDLGYPSAPLFPGLTEYQIFIIEYNAANYGETVPIDEVRNGSVQPSFTSYIQIDNDFREYKTRGLKAAQVTAAHEYHHAIQLGNFGWWMDHSYYYEMTATHFEELVFPDVNDYLIYLKDFFLIPEHALTSWRGYEVVLLPKMLYARWGAGPVRRSWELIRSMAPIPALEQALIEAGTRLDDEYCTFARWNWFTGYRSDRNGSECYDDASLYPRMDRVEMTMTADKPVTFTDNLPPLSAQYYSVYRELDTLSFSVANVDVVGARNRNPAALSYQLTVARSPGGPEWKSAGTGFWYHFAPSQPNLLCLSNLSGTFIDNSVVSVYPNPWDPRSGDALVFPLPPSTPPGKAVLTLLSVSMVPVYQKEESIQRDHPQFGTHLRLSDAASLRNLPSGVYFWHLDIDGGKTGKIAVLRP